MTEQEWLGSTDPQKMLEALGPRATERKRRLFLAACARHVYHLLTDGRSREAVEAAERLADGAAGAEECAQIHRSAYNVYEEGWGLLHPRGPVSARAALLAASAVSHDLPFAVSAATGLSGVYADDTERQHARLSAARLLREIFGNPFRPVALQPSWLTEDVIDLARLIYEERSFERLPLLAYALRDAGCNCEPLLEHCWSKGPHVLGCWALDLILGKV